MLVTAVRGPGSQLAVAQAMTRVDGLIGGSWDSACSRISFVAKRSGGVPPRMQRCW